MTEGGDKTRADQKAKAAARQRKWRAANPLSPEQKTKAAERARKWRQANADHYRAYMTAYRDANREQLIAQNVIYEQTRRRRPASKSGASENGLAHHEDNLGSGTIITVAELPMTAILAE